MEPPEDHSLTLGKLWKTYETEMTALPGIGREYARFAATFLEDFGPGRLALSLQPKDVKAWMREKRRALSRTGRPFSPAAVNRHVAFLRRLFNLARRDQLTQHQPVVTETMLRENNKRKRVLEVHEEEALRALCGDRFWPDFWRACELVLVTGLRRQEVCRLQRTDLDLRRGLYCVGASKGHDDEWLPLHPRAVELLQDILRELPRGELRMFPDLNPGRVTGRWRLLCRRAGVRGLIFHDLRRTFISRLLEAGVPRATVQELARHDTPEMTDRYKYLSTAHLRDALGHIGNGFGSHAARATKYPRRHEVIRFR